MNVIRNSWPFRQFLSLFLLLAASIASAQSPKFVLKPARVIDELNSYSEGLATARKDGRYGFIDTNANWIITPAWSEAASFHNGLARVGITDTAYNTRYGFIDRSGKLIIPIRYDEAHDFSDGLAAVRKGDSWEYINRSGRTVLDSSYVFRRQVVSAYAQTEREETEPQDFRDGLLVMRRGNRWGFADTTGKMVIPCQFSFAHSFSDGMARVGDTTDDSYICYIDQTGKMTIRIPAEQGEDFHDSLAAFQIRNSGSSSSWSDRLWGFLNRQGQIIIPPDYREEPKSFVQGISFVQINGKAEGNSDGYIRIINRQGQPAGTLPLCEHPENDSLKKCIYDSDLQFSEGLLAVKQGNRWGYIDSSGRWAIPPIFDTALPFRCGRAVVKLDTGELDIIRRP